MLLAIAAPVHIALYASMYKFILVTHLKAINREEGREVRLSGSSLSKGGGGRKVRKKRGSQLSNENEIKLCLCFTSIITIIFASEVYQMLVFTHIVAVATNAELQSKSYLIFNFCTNGMNICDRLASHK